MRSIERLAILETEIRQLKREIKYLRNIIYLLFSAIVANIGIPIII